MTDRVVVSAPAKVNLHLSVGDRRTDGYHEVATVMQALALHDTLVLEPAARLSVETRPDLGISGPENLAAKAATALAEAVGQQPAFSIRIRKRIPVGAGLGGGSADAAAALFGLALAWGIEPDAPVLRDVAAAIGADVPFFLDGGCAWMAGRGDELVRRLAAPVLHVAIVHPGASIGTAEAYRAFDAAPHASLTAPDAMLAALAAGDAAAVGAALYDAMAPAAVGLVPQVGEALAWMGAARGVLGACLAGSGSAVFGIFADEASAAGAASVARERGWWATATGTRAAGVESLPGEAEEESE